MSLTKLKQHQEIYNFLCLFNSIMSFVGLFARSINVILLHTEAYVDFKMKHDILETPPMLIVTFGDTCISFWVLYCTYSIQSSTREVFQNDLDRLRTTYSVCHLIGSRIIESATYFNQISVAPLLINNTQNSLVNRIIRLLLSLLCRPKVILLSDGHCITNIFLIDKIWKLLHPVLLRWRTSRSELDSRIRHFRIRNPSTLFADSSIRQTTVTTPWPTCSTRTRSTSSSTSTAQRPRCKADISLCRS